MGNLDHGGAVKILPFPKQRPLSVVLAELILCRAELNLLSSRAARRDPTEAEDARWTQLEDTIDARRVEAKALIAEATGVSWDAIEEAMR